jgi:hypothetical protein
MARKNNPSMKVGSVWNFISIQYPAYKNKNEDTTMVKPQALSINRSLYLNAFSFFLRVSNMIFILLPSVHPASHAVRKGI